MKTAVLPILILSGMLTAKAQNNSSLNAKGIDNNVTYYPDTVFKSSSYTVYANLPVGDLNKALQANANTDHMPVAKPQNSDQRMPVVQTDKTGYTMPVAGKNLPQVYKMSTNPVIKVDSKRP